LIPIHFDLPGVLDVSGCKDCPPGYYCEGVANIIPDGLCDEGFYCKGGAISRRPFDLGQLVNVSGSERQVTW